MRKKRLVMTGVLVVVLTAALVGVISHVAEQESRADSGTAWTSRHETVKQVSFELGPLNTKNVRFFLPTSSAWKEMEFSVDMQSSSDVDVVLWQYEDEDWNKEREWKGVSSLNQSFSYYDGGKMSLEAVNNFFESKDVSMEIERSWKERR